LKASGEEKILNAEGAKVTQRTRKKPEINKELAIAVMPVYSCKGSAE
jgi:hypothetical protein